MVILIQVSLTSEIDVLKGDNMKKKEGEGEDWGCERVRRMYKLGF